MLIPGRIGMQLQWTRSSTRRRRGPRVSDLDGCAIRPGGAEAPGLDAVAAERQLRAPVQPGVGERLAREHRASALRRCWAAVPAARRRRHSSCPPTVAAARLRRCERDLLHQPQLGRGRGDPPLRVPRRLVAGEHLAREFTKQRHRGAHALPRRFVGAGQEVAPAQGSISSRNRRRSQRIGSRKSARRPRPMARIGPARHLVAHAVLEHQGLDHAHVVVELDDRLGRGVAVGTAKTQLHRDRAARASTDRQAPCGEAARTRPRALR
jgi:hypothetical protein